MAFLASFIPCMGSSGGIHPSEGGAAQLGGSALAASAGAGEEEAPLATAQPGWKGIFDACS